jgi:CubicO group peptidase (beta-lactamase class C family)
MRIVTLLLALVVGLPAAGGAQPATTDRAAALDAIFADYNSPDSPGCAVGVYQGDRLAASRAYGMANLDHDVPLTTRSVFHVASVSKQFTAAAILLLAGDGKLSLDDEVRTYISELPDFGRPITIRQLAHHTSGIRDQWSLLGLAGWRYSRDLITDDDVVSLLSRQQDLNFEPGARHLYSNSGYTLMALIVSRVSGQSFRAFTTERIFEPLGMQQTHFRDNFAEIVKQQAYGYARDGAGFRLSVTNFDTAGATSLLTTVEDLARWHANFDTLVVGGKPWLTALLERGVLNSGETIEYAFGITHGTYRGLPTVGHGGSDAGYRAAFLRFPEQRFGVATLCNIASANPTELTRRVADAYLEDALQPVTAAADEANGDEPEVALAAERLSALAGLYWNHEDLVARRFEADGGRLYALASRGRQPLKSLGDGRFVSTSGPRTRLVFEAGERGAARLAVGATVFERRDPFAPTAAQLADFAGTYRSDEIELAYRLVVHEGGLRLERLKAQPAALQPVIADTFTGQPGTFTFVRDGAGRVTGFLLDAGRVRHVKFRRDTVPGT